MPLQTRSTVALMAALLAIAGCTTPQHRVAETGMADGQAMLANTTRQHAAVGAGGSDSAPAQPSYVEKPTAFISRGRPGQTQQVREERNLPPLFEEPYTLMLGDQSVPLVRLAREIEQELRIPVRILPDVIENPALPLATGSAAAGSAAAPQAPGSGMATVSSGPLVPGGARQPPGFGPMPAPTGQASGQPVSYMPVVTLNMTGTRRDVLNAIAAKAGIEWDYVDGEIQFSRLVARTFHLEGSARVIDSSDTLKAVGGASGQAGSANTSSNATNEVAMTASINALADFEQQLMALRSPRGRIVLSHSNNTVLVRDTRSVVEQAAALVDRFNTLASRQVVIDLDVLSVTNTDSNNYGFDLNLVLQRFTGAGTPGSLIRINPAPALTGTTTPGVVSYTVQDQSAHLNGSQLLTRALMAYGATRTVHRGSKATRNNVPAEFQSLRDVSYVATITPAPAGPSGTTGGTPGITQSVVTTGFISKIYPTVLTGNRVLLDGIISISNLDRLNAATSGGNTVQSPDVSRINAPFHNIVRSGDYIAFQVFERDASNGNRQGLEPSGILGFSAAGSRTVERFVVVMRVTILGA